MALHRDIYWVGRQWAVTGFGIQAVDQRLQGTFDIECSQVWDDGLQALRRAHAWVNKEDFDKAVMIARQRFPEPAGKSLPLVESVLEMIQQPAPALSRQQIPPPLHDEASLQRVDTAAPVERSLPLHLHMQGQLARFVPQWRVKR
jgi:hypothetical protein